MTENIVQHNWSNQGVFLRFQSGILAMSEYTIPVLRATCVPLSVIDLYCIPEVLTKCAEEIKVRQTSPNPIQVHYNIPTYGAT